MISLSFFLPLGLTSVVNEAIRLWTTIQDAVNNEGRWSCPLDHPSAQILNMPRLREDDDEPSIN